jgi:hypothetical protein
MKIPSCHISKLESIATGQRRGPEPGQMDRQKEQAVPFRTAHYKAGKRFIA